MTSVAIANRDKIIQQVAEGTRLIDIAAELDISAQAISKELRADPEYLLAREVGHASRLDQAERAIEGALDQVDVARARTLWGAYSWRAEREMPHIWGQKNRLDVSVTLGLDTVLSEMPAIPGLSTRVDEETGPESPA